ncbi:MAG: MBL fold metallo-hydrolase [Solobacterium sp.]|nr:MBL fold metallo-hydrolase [Solobacterium sp.]
MKAVILGSGTPNAEPWASGPCTAVIMSDGRVFLNDCGAGTVRACTKAFYDGVSELRPQNLTHVFLTHLHSDHTTGLADVILTPWVLERKEALHVYGPKGTDSMCSHILAAYTADIQFRTDGPEPIDPESLQVETHIVSEGTVYEKEGLKITAFPVSHGTMESYGYIYESDEGKIVISGDTCPLETMTEAARGADILIHEAEYAGGLRERTEAWQAYHRAVHTLSYDLGRIMEAAKPVLTVTTHRILHLDYYGDACADLSEVQRREDLLLQEIRSVTGQEAVNGHDGDVFAITPGSGKNRVVYL